MRNGDGDELVFVHEGSGELFCDYGHLTIRDGDYVMLPRGTLWRLEITTPVAALLIEATNDSYRLPDRESSENMPYSTPLRSICRASTTHFAPNKRKPSGASWSNGAAR